MKIPTLVGSAALGLLLGGCASAPSSSAAAAHPTPADAFYSSVAALCGQAFAGRVVVDRPAQAPSAFDHQPLVMHVRECDAGTVRIPFHVGDDHSRTWVLTRTGDGLRLKHDHRHADGSDDAVTMYGGDTDTPGTALRQEFPVDAHSVAMFTSEGMQASTRNTWAMEIEAGRRFVYELARPDGRLFRVEFDLAEPVALPPPPWGAADAALSGTSSVPRTGS